MSAQRTVSSANPSRTTLRLIAALVLGVALGAAGALLITARTTDASRRRETARTLSPDRSRVALARETRCGDGICLELAVGASEYATTVIGAPGSRTCSEIVWTPDDKGNKHKVFAKSRRRVGFQLLSLGRFRLQIQRTLDPSRTPSAS